MCAQNEPVKFVSDWVADPENLADWEKGLQQLSQIILVNNDPESKDELKKLLDDYLRYALDSPNERIREFGVFYCLAWKKMELLQLYTRDDAYDLLLRSLAARYETYSFKYLDFGLFIFPDREESLASVSALLNKRLSSSVLAVLERWLAAHESAPRALHSIEELTGVLGIPRSEALPLLARFWQTCSARICEAHARADYASAHIGMRVVSAFPKIFRDFTQEYCALLQRHIARAEDAFLPELFAWMLAWGCRDCLAASVDSILKHGNDLLVQVLRGRYARLDIEANALRRLADFVTTAGVEPQEGVRELLLVCMQGIAGEVHVPRLKQAIREGLEDPGRREEAYAIYMLLTKTMHVKSGDIEAAHMEYLSRLWDSIAGVCSFERLRRVLEIAEQLAVISKDPFLESEFFFPLLRTYLFSASNARSSLALDFADKRRDLIPMFQSWLTEPETQNTFLEGLESQNVQVQMHSLNRMRAIYCRLPIVSMYLKDRLEKFERELSDSPLAGLLKQRMLRTSGYIIAHVASCANEANAATAAGSAYGSG